MIRERPTESKAEELLAYDLAVCAWLESAGGTEAAGGEIPFDAAPAPGSRVTLLPELTLAGFDEAGRGAVAGPVVVACVCLDLRPIGGRGGLSDLVESLRGVDDSKRLSAKKREDLFGRITKRAAWGVGSSSADDIDRIGIVSACRLAAARAYRKLGAGVDVGLFDRGLSLRPIGDLPQVVRALPIEVTSTGADGRSLHVASASIVAKVTRDRMMCRLDEAFRGYGLARHKGYGTAAHREAMDALGASRIHRRTFLKGQERAKSQSC
jgi:ribonuclease HII